MAENYLKRELYDLVNSDADVFEFIQSGSLDGIWYWDLVNPENEWMSPKFWETLGYDPNEKAHLAKEWQDIIFEEDLAVATENFIKHCADPNHPYDQIVRYRHKSGSVVWIRCRGLAIRDSNGVAVRMLGAHTDITTLKEAEREILRLTEEYEKVFNGTQDAMFLMRVLGETQFRFIRNNLAHQNRTGILLHQIMDKTPDELLGTEQGRQVTENYLRCMREKKSITYEEVLKLPAGERVWSTTLTPVLQDGEVAYIVGSSTDITERKKLELELETNANYDKLTGLPNRRLFFERLERMVLESERDGRSFALMFIDLDGFKFVNDQFGHEAGDAVLQEVGFRLADCVRKSDTVARMGGDEFTVIARNIQGDGCIDRLVMKIREALKMDITVAAGICRVDSSIGVSIYPHHGISSEALIRNADAAMYEVKKNGKGGYKVFEAGPAS